jgi:hypothetical protein
VRLRKCRLRRHRVHAPQGAASIDMTLRNSLRAFLSALLVLAAGAAAAQLRTIPADARRGELRHVQESLVEINGTRAILAPGAQIRDATNLIVLPAAVPANALVKFQVDASGQVSRVWILNAQEAAQPDPRR